MSKPSNPFPPASRYYTVEIATLVDADGTQHPYLRRRFLPPSSRFALVQEYAVVAGDRLDNLAARFVGDAEQFWKLADANDAMAPDELTDTVGRKLRITLPQGIPGPGGGTGG
jgi:hypothetical protein